MSLCKNVKRLTIFIICPDYSWISHFYAKPNIWHLYGKTVRKQYVTYPHFPFSLYLLFWRVKTQVNVNKLKFYGFCTHYWHTMLFDVFFLVISDDIDYTKYHQAVCTLVFYHILCLISKPFGKLLWQNDGSWVFNIHRNHRCLTLMAVFIYLILLWNSWSPFATSFLLSLRLLSLQSLQNISKLWL